ncbi:ragulator complex protein LAMTOR4-like [Branchiostoma floridae x Branchiostoma japonicum]|uniref:Ragulator complex protein LAMTOR4 n=1 Tax=Branchiostoma floridae TaxID=7739 RepID=C3ZE23_BRAFL|eukprot:XP_002592968.1 hypothetical protein BRAFLDRAFT_65552 [Branchiostoma floridae]
MTTSPITASLDRVPDQVGYLVMNEDGAVMASSGELENDEAAAGVIMKMVDVALRLQTGTDKQEPFKRLSVIYDEHMYMVTISNQKIYVSKRTNEHHEPITV